jgi:hypothetical protein
MIERNHGQLSFSWLWPADRLGCYLSDPRYFTHVGRVVFINGRWTRPTKAPSHKCGVGICQGTRIGADGKADAPALWLFGGE